MDEIPAEPPIDPLKDQRDDVFRQIGRNVMLFQQVEHALKALLSASTLEGATPGEIETYRARRRDALGKKTLGNLVGQFTEEVLGTEQPDEGPPADDRIRIKTTFRIEGEAYYQEKKTHLARLVQERNDLVHHSQFQFDLWSAEGLATFSQQLEEQAHRFRAQVKELRTTIDSMNKAFQSLGGLLGSEEGIALCMLNDLQSSPIVSLLTEIADDTARPDGWSLLALAGGHLRERAPEVASSYTREYGHKTLKALLVASEMFEVKEEHLENGHHRLVFRPKR